MEELQKYTERYVDYLEEIRRRLYNIVIFFGVVFTTGFLSTAPLVKVLTGFFTIKDVSIVATTPFQLLDLAMDVGLFCAVVLTIPLLVYHVYRFLRPGLLPRERRIFFVVLPVALLLFAVGFTYAFATMYYALHAIAAINVGLGVVNLWDVSLFISQMIMTSILLGLLFEFPLVISFLIMLGVMSVEFLRSKRRHAIVLIFIFVSLLPPTDGLSLILMSAPLVAIYELTIIVNSKRGDDANVVVPT